MEDKGVYHVKEGANSTQNDKKADPRHPVEVRKMGVVVQILGNDYPLLLPRDGPSIILPKECLHMVGSDIEIVYRQIPPNPAAAH